jgi:hypothetical protein
MSPEEATSQEPEESTTTDAGVEPSAPDDAKSAETTEPAAKDEKDSRDTTEDDLKARATDQNKARQLARDNRARAEAVTAILGGTTRPVNIFLDSTIGLVETGGQRPLGVSGGVATGSVTEEALRFLATTFVEPSSYAELRRQLREHLVIMLRAAPGWGRTTTALRLLHSECAEGVEKLNPDVSLRIPKDLELRSGRGHLLEWLDVDEARRLHEFHFDQLKRTLRDRGARLIVLLDPTTPIREHALSSFIVDGGVAPDGNHVVAKHFGAHLTVAGKAGQAVRDFPQLAGLISEVVQTTHRLAGLAEFARDLGEVVLDRVDLAAIESRYADTAEAAFREWFDGLADNDQRAFAIALSVFNGMPMHTVAVSATILAKDMQAAENPDRRTRTRSLFALRRGDLIGQVGAEVVTASELTDLGPLAAHVVRYRDDRRPRKVLEHVWWEYDEAHRIVRNWLYELGSSLDYRIRTRAGVAVGLLGLSEFDHVRQFVIERWADANSALELEAVKGALELPAQQPELQPLLIKMLSEWLKSKSTGRKVAAIHALGTFGLVSPGRALRLMRKATGAKNAELDVQVAVGDAVINLAIIPGRLGQVMLTVLKWSDELRISVRNTGLLCALRLASYLEVSIEDSLEPWPALLHVAEHEPDTPHAMVYEGKEIGYRRLVVTLLGRLLSAPFYMPAAFAALKAWVEVAQKDPAQRKPLGQLLRDLAEETGDEASLRFYLGEWSTGRKNYAEAVTDIVAVLDREGQHCG